MSNEIVVKQGDVSLTITCKTPRTELRFKSLRQKFVSLYEPIAKELGEDPNAVFLMLSEWCEVACIVSVIEGDIDFIFPVGADSIDDIHDKFMTYLDTRYHNLIEYALRASKELEAPLKPHLAPHIVPDDTKKKRNVKVS